MTLFEYLAAGYVLMLSFAVLRGISGVPHALRPSAFYWVHAAWLFTGLVLCLTAFWAFWPYREIEWTIGTFVSSLITPALLYAFVSLLVPPDPAAVVAWRDHFYANRARIFGTGVALMVNVTLSNQVVLGVPALATSQLGNYASTGVFLAGVLSANSTVHAVLVPLNVAIGVFFFTIMGDPNSTFGAAF